MKNASKPAADPGRRQAVIYARVSSKEQEKEGFSIPAQLKLLKEYAAANGFAVAQKYVDVETAKQTGRAAFGEMVAYLAAHSSVPHYELFGPKKYENEVWDGLREYMRVKFKIMKYYQ